MITLIQPSPRSKSVSVFIKNQPSPRSKSVSVFIKFQSVTGTLKIYRDPIINMVHAPNKVNVCTKYQQDLLWERWEDRWMNGQTDRQAVQGMTIPSAQNGPMVKLINNTVKFHHPVCLTVVILWNSTNVISDVLIPITDDGILSGIKT